MIFKKRKILDGIYNGIITGTVETRNNSVIVQLKLEVGADKPIEISRWLNPKDDFNNSFDWFCRDFGLLEGNDKVIDFKQVVGRRIIAKVTTDRGLPGVNWIKPVLEEQASEEPQENTDKPGMGDANVISLDGREGAIE